MPKKADSDANRMVSSNMITMNDGQLFSGRAADVGGIVDRGDVKLHAPGRQSAAAGRRSGHIKGSRADFG